METRILNVDRGHATFHDLITFDEKCARAARDSIGNLGSRCRTSKGSAERRMLDRRHLKMKSPPIVMLERLIPSITTPSISGARPARSGCASAVAVLTPRLLRLASTAFFGMRQ